MTGGAAASVGDLRRLVPLLDDDGRKTVERICGHPSAPRLSQLAGDRLDRADVDAVARFQDELGSRRVPFAGGAPTDAILAWVDERRRTVPSFARRIREGARLAARWSEIATASREDVALRPESLVPADADLARMLVYRTAGTTGHALLVAHDRRAAACYLPLLELALARHDVHLRLGPGEIACFLVGAQERTVTYATALSAWAGAGFAKLNLRPGEWRRPDDPRRFFSELAPQLLTGDPISFAELARLDVPVRPRAMVTTAVAMTDGLRERLSRRFGCPVIDWYSLTETGPIGYACPSGPGYHVAPHDLFVEAIDEHGRPVGPGQRGEIAVTGGRNPFVALLRYRTGDWGRIEHAPCACGDPMPRICDLEGRSPVLLRAASGAIVNPVDVSGVLRGFAVVQHELVQRRDGGCDVTVRPLAGAGVDAAAIREALRALLGDVRIDVTLDPALGDRAPAGKVLPYRSELLLED